MTRLMQIKKGSVRQVALVEEPHLRLLDGCSYELIYTGRSEWQMLPAIDPLQVSSLLPYLRHWITMHATVTEDLTDRMKMFRWGVEGGRLLMNPVRVEKSKPGIVKVVPLG